MSEHGEFAVRLSQLDNYRFQVDFDWADVPPIILDEPEPLGAQTGPNASRVLAAAVGNCLSASLLFCLQKARIEVKNIATDVRGSLVRNPKGRLRIGKLEADIHLDAGAIEPRRLERCLGLFEDFCVVTASVRKSIPVRVRVLDPSGNVLYEAGAGAGDDTSA